MKYCEERNSRLTTAGRDGARGQAVSSNQGRALNNAHQLRVEPSPAVKAVKVLLVDHPPTRAGIRMALAGEVEICAECGEVDRAIRAAKLEQPDIALIGREIAGDWRIAVRGVCRAAPHCAVIVLAQSPDADDMLESVRAGAQGYVPGTLGADNLRSIFRFARTREALIPRTMVLELLTEIRGTSVPDSGLTGREAQVLGMVRRGHSTAWIAERLQIAPVTVRRHISELVHKLGVASRSDLVEHRIEPGRPVRS
jgi:two-component system, NarL family, nitrate/nitrite response regulator NarL